MRPWSKNVLRGMSTVLDIAGDCPPLRFDPDDADDSQVLARDWGTVGSDTRRAFLDGLVQQLDQTAKIVLVLYYYEGRTISEIAQSLGLPRAHVMRIHSRVIEQLRAQLKEQPMSRASSVQQAG